MIDSIVEQESVETDSVKGFWVLKQEDDDRGEVYPTVMGFLVPSFDNLFFTPDLGVVRCGFREHESGGEIILGEALMVPVDIVFKVVNFKRLKPDLEAWFKSVSPVSSEK